jgi:hypothetical protein
MSERSIPNYTFYNEVYRHVICIFLLQIKLIIAHQDTHFEFLQNVDIGEKFIVNSRAENNELIYEVVD